MRSVFRWSLRLLALAALVLLVLVAAAWIVSEGIGGELHERGTVARDRLPSEVLTDRSTRQSAARESLGVAAADQILFGDLHVHTTYSSDAFVFSLPLMQGEGVHPPADACDFARFCAELDFWSINDHAEHLTPFQWNETVASIQECNDVAGNPADPDLVSFLGWEWTQSATGGAASGRTHYGHKNVVLREADEGRVPERPIGAGAGGVFAQVEMPAAAWAAVRASLTLGDLGAPGPYLDFNRYARDVRDTPDCPTDLPSDAISGDCIEGAETPEILFRKLSERGHDHLVIPHGTTWGIHAPPDADLRDQLAPGGHEPARQTLFEVYSGHGTSERFRELRDTVPGEDEAPVCAPPNDGYLPCCWRAGELIAERCSEAPEVCDARVEETRRFFLEAAPAAAKGVVADTSPDDWLECGQLPGFLPALEYRPKMSAQYGLAVRDRSAGPEAGAFRFGLIGSSDNHKARAGAGYKEIGRTAFGDAYGLRQDWRERLAPEPSQASELPVPPSALPAVPLSDPGAERNASYYFTAGLVAVHAPTRDRDAIFESLRARRAYGTSGPRILLWFDLENGPEGAASMGSEVRVGPGAEAPRFTVRAAGAFEQRPGCPDHTKDRLSPERLQRLCLDECYHPADTRHRIERIEVVRIRPQVTGDEPVAERIDDPWRSFVCEDEGDGCSFRFEDPEYSAGEETLYYVRALQEPTPAVNGDPMRCERDEQGRCVKARFCPASGEGSDPDDECLSPVRERAWSSPIWLRPASGTFLP